MHEDKIIMREDAFQYYFYFLEERMKIFWNKYNKEKRPWTIDNILHKHKFTNVYRSCDRVSQYLIRHVIYNQSQKYSEEDTLLRILIFKVFNRIDTWEYILENFGEISIKNFDVDKLTTFLSIRIKNRPIFNSAYLMTGSHNDYKQYSSKHERWLRMIDFEFIQNKKIKQVLKSKNLGDIFNLLSQCPFIGDFLAYQYTIDFNYSEAINYDENSFVKAGIGSIRGIKKCFYYDKTIPYESYIIFVKNNLSQLKKKFGCNKFINLFGREPTLIDLQNCFCETDKYLREKMPELVVDNTRIKQRYTKKSEDFELFFPPKWGINDKIKKGCLQQNTTELTLF